MEYKVVPILSSREFYKMVDILNIITRPDETCILDLTNVNRIDAVVIPNLLLLGEFIEKKTTNIPWIRLGEDLSSGYLKKYLMNIKFFELSKPYFYYENEFDKYSGLVGKEMDRRNTTERFLLDEGPVVAQRRFYYKIYPFIRDFLDYFNTDENAFENVWDSNTFYNNTIATFLKEMIDNSFQCGRSDVIITVQKNYKKEKIFLSISDSGMGFLASMLQNMDEYGNFIPREDIDPGYNILGKLPEDDVEAIIIGIYKRMHSKTYGLFNVVKRTLMLHGTIRIHTNNIQFILTERLKSSFLQTDLIRNTQQLLGYNVIKTSCFNGAHIELELPFFKAERNYSNVYY